MRGRNLRHPRRVPVGSGERGAGFFFGVHNVAVNSKGNVYTTEVFEGKRTQKFKVVSGAPVK